MKSLRRLSLATFLLAIALATTQPASARLGDDRDALQKRFGNGKTVKQSEQVDLGLWDLFDEVLFFQKNGIDIVAGISAGKCLAISYQYPKMKEGEAGESFNWSEAQVLIEKNTGGSPSISESSIDGNPCRHYEGDVFAKLEIVSSYSVEYFTRIAFYNGELFENFADFKEGVIRSEFLKKSPPKNLAEF